MLIMGDTYKSLMNDTKEKEGKGRDAEIINRFVLAGMGRPFSIATS